MKYKLKWCSWEITRRCNMDCGICLCGGAQNNGEHELNTEEALALCDQLIDMQVDRVVLTGGEPLMRQDWPLVVKKLTQNGIQVQMISNGYFMDQQTVAEIQDVGISKVGISIDGPESIHDAGRILGSYAQCRQAIYQLHKAEISVTAATTVTQKNFAYLEKLKAALINDLEITHWVIQLGLPFGNFVSKPEDTLLPEQIPQLIDLCYEFSLDKRILIHPLENIGYYTKKEAIMRSRVLDTEDIPIFRGCPAGISSLNIAHDGTILGISMCISNLFEGNIRTQTIKEIWENPMSFSWRRNVSPEKLNGYCKKCTYSSICLGGCPAVRYSLTGDIHGENTLCAYRTHMLNKTSKHK